MAKRRLNRIAFLKQQGWHRYRSLPGWWVRPNDKWKMGCRMYSLTEAYNTAVKESLRIVSHATPRAAERAAGNTDDTAARAARKG